MCNLRRQFDSPAEDAGQQWAGICLVTRIHDFNIRIHLPFLQLADNPKAKILVFLIASSPISLHGVFLEPPLEIGGRFFAEF